MQSTLAILGIASLLAFVALMLPMLAEVRVVERRAVAQ